jgi:hypothetical protein
VIGAGVEVGLTPRKEVGAEGYEPVLKTVPNFQEESL